MISQDFENPRMWEMPKPFFQEWYVPFSVYDETFHTWPLTDASAPLDPCCTSCRIAEDRVMLVVYSEDESYQPIWDSILEGRAGIAHRLEAKLAAIQARNLLAHYEENLPGMPVWEAHWKFILQSLGGTPEPPLSRMFKLTGISIAASEPENEWVVGYNFQTGWDMDHGLEIVTWSGKVLAAGGMLELTSTGGSVFAGVRAIQAYELDAGDEHLDAAP